MFGVIGIVLGIVGASQVVQFGQNLEATIQTGRPLLVQFYAPWCGHCQQLAPTWEKVADKIGREVAVGKLDCTQYQNLAQKYGIRGFPTIKFFRNGRPIDYEGGRTEVDIVKFVSRASGPAVVKLTKTLNSLIKSRPDPPVFVLVGEKGEEFNMYEQAAEAYIPNRKFFYIPAFHDAKIAVVKDGQMIDYNKLEEPNLKKWVESEKESTFGEFSMKVAKRNIQRGKFIVVAVDKVDGSEKTNIVSEVALSRNELFKEFIFTNGFTDIAKRSIDHLTYRESSEGDIVVLPKGEHNGYYYMLQSPADKVEFEDFLNEIRSGRAELNGKSAIGRFFADFINGFIRLFKENPILGGLIVGIPILLISFIIWGICSIPEGEDEDYSDSGTDGDISDNADEYDTSPVSDGKLVSGLRQRRDITDSSDSEIDELPETSKDK